MSLGSSSGQALLQEDYGEPRRRKGKKHRKHSTRESHHTKGKRVRKSESPIAHAMGV